MDVPSMPGQETAYNTILQKVAQKVSSAINGPAVLIFRNGKHWLAVKEDCLMAETLKIPTSPFPINVSLTDQVYKVEWNNRDNYSNEIVEKFLDFEIRKQLRGNFDLWGLTPYQFFKKTPLQNNDEGAVDIFQGFKYRLVPQSDGHFYISLDLAFKYIGKEYLSYYVRGDNKDKLSQRLKGRKCLYQNGDNWYQVEIAGFGKKIKEHELSFNGSYTNVQKYILEHTKNHKFNVSRLINPEHPTLLYKYPNRNMEPHCGATSLARIIYNTSDKEAKRLHRSSIKPPEVKFDLFSQIISKCFQKLKYKNIYLDIATDPLKEREAFFDTPSLKFQNDNILSVTNDSESGNTSLKDYGIARKQMITDNGILCATEFDTQYLIVPDSLDNNLVEEFKKRAEGYIKKLAPKFSNFKVINYVAKPNLAATLQVQEIEKTLNERNALNGFALFILPDLHNLSHKTIGNFHDCLKNKFFPNLKFQCASAHKIKSFYDMVPKGNGDLRFELSSDKVGDFKSYLFNLMMEYLLVNRKWPYSLANNPHYDIYIGIDVHERYAGFTFFYKNGEHIFFDFEKIPKKVSSGRYEKVKKELIVEKILKKLEVHIPKYVPNPNGIVIIRDGKSFDEEKLALDEVVGKLSEKGLVDKTILKFGVIDLHKQSAIPLRIASVTNGYDKLENPRAGSYKLLSQHNGFLFSTGFPFKIPGTAKPIQLIMRSGNVNFLWVMEDIFGQIMMAFSAPDRSNSLPIVIKLNDVFLGPLATEFEDEEFVDEVEEVELLS